ncbi:hypothetical protein [Methylorubrum sp. SL192]|uniref:hypothetical protein n=1 Tax=Methylorubrum sp. SL192 TaxID=2995167 RepID=UPI0006F61C61|nr:hypothetical protein [Methylorubrum sp. SL192]KQO89442.1 hypothetical protein ASF33_19110 [Methylobacterium sp. Leaf92]MCY1644936.1 hypothetical protein [Methylorubrum sp. SL192]
MIRAAAILLLGALAATPAAAACRTVPELVEVIRAPLPPQAFVGELSASVVPTVLAWLESEGLPHRADRIVQVAGDRGLALVLISGELACAGAPIALQIFGTKAVELARLVRRFRELKGYGPELPA